MPKRSAIVCYMPALHRGYLQFFDALPGVEACYVLPARTLREVDYLKKDLRALTPDQQVNAISGLGRFKKVELLTTTNAQELINSRVSVIMPDEDISRHVADSLLRGVTIKFMPVFLRWDRKNVEGINAVDDVKKVSSAKFDKDVMAAALKEAGLSSDIWRRVGAVLITDNKKYKNKAHNTAEPTAHSPWIEGDPRNVFKRGVGIEMSVFIHAEAKLIAEAAKEGIALSGASIYVTTFPCPACAKLIAHSGIKKCYYREGYAVLDGRRVLDDHGVDVIKVEVEEPDESLTDTVPYKIS